MVTVALYTRDGEAVYTGQIPRFNPAPEVLFWGDRVFWRWNETPEQDLYRYKEAFAYTIGIPEAPETP